MSKHHSRRSTACRLSSTLVPVLMTVGLASGGVAGALVGQLPDASAANPCNPCNPCAANNPCNPCNPCGASNPCNPCNPCGGGTASFSEKCNVPRLAAAKPNPCAASNPCNPCAAKNACNPCNPCAAKKAANPCNPCNPCAANPCNPCGAAAAVELSAAEANAAYECLLPEMLSAYQKSGFKTPKVYAKWTKHNVQPYPSGTHGGRHVNNYTNKTAKAYGRFEQAGKMPVGSLLVKDSFAPDAKGRLSVGPFFMMEKMKAGFYAASGDWRYTLIGPDGIVMGQTQGRNSKSVEFCAECHAAVGDTQDHMMFMPEEFRAK